MRWLRTAALGTAVALVLATPAGMAVAVPAGAATGAGYVQSSLFDTGSPVPSVTVTLSQPVQAGDLLVGWFAQYNAAGQASVSDSVNGPWTRAADPLTFSGGSGDIALFYVAATQAAADGLTITVSAGSATYLEGAVAEYSGVAGGAPLLQIATVSGKGTAVSAGPTPAEPAGDLVYAAEVTGTNPGSATPGGSAGVAYTGRAQTADGDVLEEDVTASAAGAQQGTATFTTAADWYAVVAVFQVSAAASPSPTPTPTGGSAPPSQIGYVQGSSFSTAPVTSAQVTLAQPVQAGDLLVGWFAQYGAPGQVQVSDNVNGGWTRAPGSLAYQNDGGDIALYYLADAPASATGVTITVTASAATYLDGTVAEYSGAAAAGPLDQVSTARGVGTSMSTGSTADVAAGDLVYTAMITGQPAGPVTPGSSQGVPYTTRVSTDNGSVDEFDITSAQAGTQTGTAALATSTDWYAVTAAFHPFPANAPAPAPPSGLTATSVAASRVALHWSAPSGSVSGYAVLRNGQPLGSTTGTSYLDSTVAPSTSYSYTVAALNGAGQQSAPAGPVQLQTPARSPTFVQGIADSPGSRAISLTLTLAKPVAAGDLLVGWFGEYNAAGQVQVSDSVNGAWTRSVAETFSGGTGDIALYYLANSEAAPDGLTVTISASAPAYLQEAIADFSGVATTPPLVQAVTDSGSGAQVAGGTTPAVPAGDLLVAGVITAGQPGTIVPGTSQDVPLAVEVQNGSASADLADILATAAGPQTAAATLGTGSGWYTVTAAFQPSGG